MNIFFVDFYMFIGKNKFKYMAQFNALLSAAVVQFSFWKNEAVATFDGAVGLASSPFWRYVLFALCGAYLPLSILSKMVLASWKKHSVGRWAATFYYALVAYVTFWLFASLVHSSAELGRWQYVFASNFAVQTHQLAISFLFGLTTGLGYIDALCSYLLSGKMPKHHALYRLTSFPLWWHALFFNEAIIAQVAPVVLLMSGIVFLYSAVSSHLNESALIGKIRGAVIGLRVVETMFLIYAYSTQFSQLAPDASDAVYWNAQISAILHIISLGNIFITIIRKHLKGFRPGISTFLLFFHVFAVVGLIRCVRSNHGGRMFVEAVLFYMVSGFGITCGAHRLWAHRSYKAHWTFRLALMLLNSIANQGTIYHWSRDHRLHHKYSEQEADPHNATRGFFYSHMGWLLLKKPDIVRDAGKEIDCSDLLEDKVVAFQKRWDPYWNQILCFVVPSIYAYYVYGNFWEGFFVLGCFRWIMCLHATWTVNSVAHLWGDRPYNPDINPAENLFTSLVAVGEGWHNWHHEYPFDYATAEGGFLTHWNPSKIIIDTAAALNLVWDRKRALQVWDRARSNRLAEQKKNVEKVAAVLKRNPSISKLPNFRGSLPAYVVKKSLIRSIFYLLQDILLCAIIAAAATFVSWSSFRVFPDDWTVSNNLVSAVCWTVYALLQGTVAFRLWILGYESAGGRFSDYWFVNWVTGVLLHSALLVPYQLRRAYKDSERPRASLTSYIYQRYVETMGIPLSLKSRLADFVELRMFGLYSVRRCLSDDAFSIFKFDMSRGFTFGGIMVALFVALYGTLMYHFGVKCLVLFYVAPLIVLNLWLLLYEWLMENGPQDCFEFDLNENILQLFTADWLLSTWPKATRGRRYPWTRIMDHLHHHLRLYHIVQAVDFDVPHYHVKEAFRRLGDLLGEVSFDVIDAKNQLVCAGLKISQAHSIYNNISEK